MLSKRTHGLGRIAVAAIAALATTGAASADHHSYGRLEIPGATNRRAYVIVKARPGAHIVTRYSADGLQTPHVVPVIVAHQDQYVSLHGEYLRQSHVNRIDDDHWILHAQRLARSYYGGHARVIEGGPPQPVAGGELAAIKPRLIIQKPGHLPPNRTEPDKSPRKPGQWVRAD